MELIDKDAVVAMIDRIYHETNYEPFTGEVLGKRDACREIKDFLDTLEVKEIVAEQEGICNNHFNRIIGDSWNLIIPIENAGLKNGDKVKIFIAKEE